MKTIVVSAVNLRKGGTLTILRNCLEYLSPLAVTGKYRVVALVHKKELADYPGIEYIEMPWCVKSWFLRLWCEYVTMRGISKKLAPVYLWLSLHDTTPNVKAERRAVYCHNPFPFYKWKWRELLLNYRIVCFAWFSKYIYGTNIHKNRNIIVQQDWIRKEFISGFGVKQDKIVIATPSCVTPDVEPTKVGDGVYRFLFASFGDIHKNFETLCEAARLLQDEVGTGKFKVVLTIGADDNKYTQWLYKKWSTVESIELAGFMDKKRLYSHYSTADCLVFPSRVETWGLPISEFAATGKPMLLADLPYAHETSAGSRQTAFFDACNAVELKNMMKKLMEGDKSFLAPVEALTPEPPVANTWQELFDILLEK